MRDSFLNASGFDPDAFSSLKSDSQLWLMRISGGVITALLVCAFSMGYFAYRSVASVAIGILVFVVILAMLMCIQALLISSAGIDTALNAEQARVWKPSYVRSGLFVFITLVFSQFVLFAISELDIMDWARGGHARNQASAALTAKEQALMRQQEKIDHQLVPVASRPVIHATSGAVRHEATMAKPAVVRKALLIGVRGYAVAPVQDATDDIDKIGSALQGLGFAVIRVSDPSAGAFYLAVQQFIQSLQPGDVSFVYFRGHVLRSGNENLLLSREYSEKAQRPVGVSLSMLSEGIFRRQVMSSIVVVDPPGVFPVEGQGLKGVAARNSLVSVTGNSSARPANFFAPALVNRLTTSGGEVVGLFTEVAEDVSKSSEGKISVSLSDDLSGHLVLAKTGGLSGDTEKPTSHEVDGSCVAAVFLPRSLEWFACLQANRLRIGDELALIQKQKANIQSIVGSEADDYLPFDFTNRFSGHFFAALFESLLTVLILSAGFVLREYLPCLAEYEGQGNRIKKSF